MEPMNGFYPITTQCGANENCEKHDKGRTAGVEGDLWTEYESGMGIGACTPSG